MTKNLMLLIREKVRSLKKRSEIDTVGMKGPDMGIGPWDVSKGIK